MRSAFGARNCLTSFLLAFIVASTFLATPRRAIAQKAWDVTNYDSSANTASRDTFAFEPTDPYQPTAGACNPYPTSCYPLWTNNTLTPGIPSGWSVKGVGDFDRNGTADLVIQNASSGQVAVSFFQGSYSQTFLSTANLASPAGYNVA